MWKLCINWSNETLGKSNLREEGLFWHLLLESSPLRWGVKAAGALSSWSSKTQSGSRKISVSMLSSISPSHSVWAPANAVILPTFSVGLPASVSSAIQRLANMLRRPALLWVQIPSGQSILTIRHRHKILMWLCQHRVGLKMRSSPETWRNNSKQ